MLLRIDLCMRILVISDSHGNLCNFIDAVNGEPSAELVYFLGDGFSDAFSVKEITPDKAFCFVKGNCDISAISVNAPYYDVRTLENVKIYATHGYIENVKFNLDELKHRAKQNNCNIALFGHTHIQHTEFVSENNLHLFNPGSIKKGEYGVIDITPKGIICISKTLF